MVSLMEYQLKQSLLNIESARKLIDKKMEEDDSDLLDDYHIELYDLELRLKDMLEHINEIEDYFLNNGEVFI